MIIASAGADGGACLNRRTILSGAICTGLAASAATTAFGGTADLAPLLRVLPAQHDWDPLPSQAKETVGTIDIGPVCLRYRDTGGTGEAVVMLHPATGSADVWAYQQPVLAARGYRVIAYSRRGHLGSDSGPQDRTGTAADDLEALVVKLKVSRFHIVGSAAGGFIAPDYAISFPHRLLSMTLACTQGGVVDPDYRSRIEAVTPPAFQALPEDLKELGPSYRAANPEGAALWTRMAHAAVPGKWMEQPARNVLNWRAIEAIHTPTLLVAGGADLYAPVPLMLEYRRHLGHAEMAILNESGHSGYWEQPRAFNKLLVDFFRRHPSTKRQS